MSDRIVQRHGTVILLNQGKIHIAAKKIWCKLFGDMLYLDRKIKVCRLAHGGDLTMWGVNGIWSG